MNFISALGLFKNILVSDWQKIDWHEVRFESLDMAIIFLLLFLAAFGCSRILYNRRKKIAGKTTIVIPAVLTGMKTTPLKLIRHLPLWLVVAGSAFLMIALADPFVPGVKEVQTFSGKRIAFVIDSSGSMTDHDRAAFSTTKLKVARQERFYTAVAAADSLVRMRIDRKYKDLMALIEFSDHPFVVTPFTNDYENILLSLSMIGEPEEYYRSQNGGTFSLLALNQAIELFRAFDFLKYSGNAIVFISDGEDWDIRGKGADAHDILANAKKFKIPVYFIRIVKDSKFGGSEYDIDWKAAVESTGGKFYPVADEASLLKALAEIDAQTPGRIEHTRFGNRQPLFYLFASAALALWLCAVLLTVAFRIFRSFP